MVTQSSSMVTAFCKSHLFTSPVCEHRKLKQKTMSQLEEELLWIVASHNTGKITSFLISELVILSWNVRVIGLCTL